GSVGASGDLAPLAHLALAMIGEGEDGGAVQARGLQPIALEAKEGLAFVNGTQAQTGVAALVIHDAWVLWRTAHAAAAMSLEATRGTPEPFDPRIHEARPHRFQQRSAALLRELLADSQIRESHRDNDPRVQDADSLRCSPQVLGAVGEGMEGRADSRERDPHRRDRAVGRGAGARVPEAAPAGARRGGELRGGSGRGPAPARRPPAHGGYRTSGGGDSRGKVRSGGDMSAPRVVRAPRGPQRSCKGWIQEAALRMLMNNLDPEVA